MYMAFYSHGSWFDNLSDWISDLAQKDPLSRAVNSLLNKVTGQGLTGAEREANAFTAQQNREAMDFEERMAKNQMDFQAQQSATQWQRGVADMKAAGLNPALAYGQGGASAMSGSSGAGHAGASVAPNSGSSLSELIQLATLKPSIENMQAQACKTNADARLNEIDAETRGQMNERELSRLLAVTNQLNEAIQHSRWDRTTRWKVERAYYGAQTDLLRINARGASLENRVKQWESEFIDKYHLPSQLAGQFAVAVAIGGSAVLNFIGKKYGIKTFGKKYPITPKAGGR